MELTEGDIKYTIALRFSVSDMARLGADKLACELMKQTKAQFNLMARDPHAEDHFRSLGWSEDDIADLKPLRDAAERWYAEHPKDNPQCN